MRKEHRLCGQRTCKAPLRSPRHDMLYFSECQIVLTNGLDSESICLLNAFLAGTTSAWQIMTASFMKHHQTMFNETKALVCKQRGQWMKTLLLPLPHQVPSAFALGTSRPCQSVALANHREASRPRPWRRNWIADDCCQNGQITGAITTHNSAQLSTVAICRKTSGGDIIRASLEALQFLKFGHPAPRSHRLGWTLLPIRLRSRTWWPQLFVKQFKQFVKLKQFVKQQRKYKGSTTVQPNLTAALD